MSALRLIGFLFFLGVLIVPSPGVSNPQLAQVEGARANMQILEPQTFRGSAFSYDHEVQVVLPASYDVSEGRTYPVLWVMDSPLMTRTVVGILDTLVMGNHVPEMIVVSVGSPAEEGLAGLGRRVMDFSPPGPDYFPPEPQGEAWRAMAPLPPFPHKADDFLVFLVDELRPQLSERYRFSGEHALFGHSAGGMFAAYALFQRPDAFEKVIIGSPYLNGVRGAVFDAEAAYATDHDDLDVSVFIGAGGDETNEYFLAISGIVSSATRLSETLHMRGYPSLTLRTRMFDGEDHYTVVPRVISEGLRHLWAEEAAELPSSWPQPPQ